MITIRKSEDRGSSKLSWLDSKHTFSFAEYYDTKFMHFGNLRVINEDIVQPGQGFGTHSHQNMEIISYVIEGQMAHKDSMGTGSVIIPGEIQRMSAGTGVQHSEFNHSNKELLHFLQIWIIPNQMGITPSYEQKKLDKIANQWNLIADEQGSDKVLKIHQDVHIYAAYLSPKHRLEYKLADDRQVWIQVVKGTLLVNQESLSAGDGAAVSKESSIVCEAITQAEILLFDLAL